MKTLNCVVMWTLLFLSGTDLWAIPAGFNIQGRLTDANGINKDDTFSIKFSVFAIDAGGSPVWEKNMPSVLVQNGNFQIILQGEGQGQGGTTIQLENAVKDLEAAYVEIKVGSDPPLVPRQPLLRSPFSSADQVGAVMWFYRKSCPIGFRMANGEQVSESLYPELAAAMDKTGTGNFYLPDLRGEFIRGVDDGVRNADPGAPRLVGSTQTYEIQKHTHIIGPANGTPGPYGGSYPIWTIDPWGNGILSKPTGSAETRPRNIALMPCIKY